jgi:hypothetical protein
MEPLAYYYICKIFKDDRIFIVQRQEYVSSEDGADLDFFYVP